MNIIAITIYSALLFRLILLMVNFKPSAEMIGLVEMFHLCAVDEAKLKAISLQIFLSIPLLYWSFQ